MFIYLCCNPYSIRVAEDPFIAVRFSATGKYYNLFTRLCVYKECFVVFVFSPPAPPTEQVLQPKAVTIPYVEFCVAYSRTACKVYFIPAYFEFYGGDYAMVNCFSGTYCTFRN